MPAPPETVDKIEALVARIALLEQRMEALEHSAHISVPVPSDATGPAPPALIFDAPRTDRISLASFSGGLTAFGASLLGIAGAYLLRAVSEADVLPRGAVAATAVLYAAGWLVAAARKANHRIFSTLYAGTSILILAPMLWEMSIRFGSMPASVAALILALYVVLAAVLRFTTDCRSVFSIAFTAAAFTGVALATGTHQMHWFAPILLLMVAACDFAPAMSESRVVRLLITLSAALVLWMLLYIYRLPSLDRADYAPLSSSTVVLLAAAFAFISLSNIAVHTVRRKRPIALFNALQAMVSLALLFIGIAWLYPHQAANVVGLVCSALSSLCAAAAFGPPSHLSSGRNFAILAAWSCVFFLAAAFLLAPAPVSSSILAAASVIAILYARRRAVLTLEFYGVLYLFISALASGYFLLVGRAFTWPMPPPISWPVALSCSHHFSPLPRFESGTVTHSASSSFPFSLTCSLRSDPLLGSSC